MNPPAPTEFGRRSYKLLAWAALPVLTLAGVVQVTGVGIDILVFATAALLLLGLERSVGDWLGEWFGPLAAAVIFIATAVALSWYFLSDSLGRSQTEHFFVEAERRGYSTVYYQTARPSAADKSGAAAESPSGATPVATGGTANARGATAVRGEAPPVHAADREDETDPQDASAISPAIGTARGARQETDAPARRSILSIFRRSSSPAELIETQVTVSLSPHEVEAARRTVISAAVHGAGVPVAAGTVEFMVNGLGAGRIAVDADGVASTTFRTHIPGTYEVRARYSGTSRHASSRSNPVLLQVSPSR